MIDRARRSDDYSLIGTDRIVDAILAEYEIRPRRDATARFWSKVDKSGECWVWTKYLNPDGYAYFWFDGRRVRAHKWAYEQEHGPVADGLVLDHLCRNRACVNPAHLEPVTTWENLRRGESFSAENVAKTHCDNGHEFTPENTYVDGNGWRACRECHRFNNRAKGQRPAICPVCGETRSAWGMSNHVKSQHGMTLTEAKVARQS